MPKTAQNWREKVILWKRCFFPESTRGTFNTDEPRLGPEVSINMLIIIIIIIITYWHHHYHHDYHMLASSIWFNLSYFSVNNPNTHWLRYPARPIFHRFNISFVWQLWQILQVQFVFISNMSFILVFVWVKCLLWILFSRFWGWAGI